MTVTIVMPNHNEPQADETLRGLLTLECPVVVANDPDGKGVGWALREGLKEVQTEWVLFAMADGSEDLGCLRELLMYCNPRYDAVWGDRWCRGSVSNYPRGKWLLNRLGNTLIAWTTTRRFYRDWTDLAKAYKTDRLRRLRWSDDFRCAVEIPVRYRPKYLMLVPMHWRERTAGGSSYRLRHALGCLLALGRVVVRG